MTRQATLPGLPQLDAEHREAMERAGRLLTIRPRTERQLRTKLVQDGFSDDAVESSMQRLRELGLVDDAAYARDWIEERTRRRGRGAEALVAELEAKGVASSVTKAVLEDLDHDERAQARDWAVRLFVKVADHPFAEQAPRLAQLLYRRGFSEDAVEEAVRAAMPPDGWD